MSRTTTTHLKLKSHITTKNLRLFLLTFLKKVFQAFLQIICNPFEKNYLTTLVSNLHLSFTVIISRQQRRMQVMRIRQRDDRYRNKKKKKHGSSASHPQQAKQLHAEPVYRRKPNPIRRYDTDVLSPVRNFRFSSNRKYFLFC